MLFVVLTVLLTGCVSVGEVLPVLSEHVLALALAPTLYTFGQWAKANARPAGASWLWSMWWRTLPLHATAAGVALGALCPALLPESVGAGRVAAAVYFGASGSVASHARAIFNTWIKYRGGSDA